MNDPKTYGFKAMLGAAFPEKTDEPAVQHELKTKHGFLAMLESAMGTRAISCDPKNLVETERATLPITEMPFQANRAWSRSLSGVDQYVR